jgi:hypothetical protein
MHNQRPSSQLHQSSHCFGSENSTAIVAPSKVGFQRIYRAKPIKRRQNLGRHTKQTFVFRMTLCGNPLLRSLLGVKRTCLFALQMSAYDPRRTSQTFSFLTVLNSRMRPWFRWRVRAAQPREPNAPPRAPQQPASQAHDSRMLSVRSAPPSQTVLLTNWHPI